jgi:hypothetical protein
VTVAGPAPRLLRVRCATWDQVEAFYRRKLRAGGRLTMKVGFATTVGAPITLVLELPNQIALSVDGEVTGGEGEGKAVEVTLRGLTAGLIGRLEALVAEARSGALDPEAQDDESRLLSARRTELARLRRLPAHEVLGVPREPSAYELRSAWLALARREHPDAVARYASPALTAAAAEVMAIAGAAYDRVRAAVVAEGRAVAAGASVRPAVGWDGDDVVEGVGGGGNGHAHHAAVEPAAPVADDAEQAVAGPMPMLIAAPDSEPEVEPVPAPVESDPTRPAVLVPMDAMLSNPHAAPIGTTVTMGEGARGSAVMAAVAADPGGGRIGAGDRFARQIRQHIALGDHGSAAHLAEAALQLYPDDPRLRGLAAVALAMAACARGDRVAAVSALEAATVADPGCGEAATALAELRHAAVPSVAMIRRWFE